MLLFIDLVLILFILFLLIVLSMVWPPDSPWAPWWRTSSQKAKLIWTHVTLTKKDVIYELGCGDAAVLREAAKYGAICLGIEIDPFRVLIARFLVWKNGYSKTIIIKRGNFSEHSFKEATVVFVYLVPRVLKNLKKKFLKELKPGI